MKKQIRRAMICSVAMMLVAIVTLTGVTYAWFSESNEATVDGITMKVAAYEGGIYISKDPFPSTFDNSISITSEEIFQGDHNPASTAGYVSGGKLQFFSGSLDSPTDKTLNEIKAVSEDGYFFEQDVYFDNSTGSKNIKISLRGTEIKPTDGKRTDLAARIAIVTHGSISTAEFAAQSAYPTAPDGKSAVQIFEPNATTHTPAGHTEYKNNMPGQSAVSDTVAYKCLGLKEVSTTEVDRFTAGPGTKLEEVTTIKKAEEVIIEVPAESYLKITVYVWLEGQDADCQNNISGKPYTADIHFTLEP